MPHPIRRRAAAAALATVLALGLLAACGDEPDDDCETNAVALVAADRPGPPRPAPAKPKAPEAPKPKHGVHLDADCD
ncbi:hypothetical protein [Streptomyces lasiicapitis]|uniref:hypothetical protein n=1 Tax=Streptomyces lasiicapitis TaxID=1923961 RepID=UPI003648DBA8